MEAGRRRWEHKPFVPPKEPEMDTSNMLDDMLGITNDEFDNEVEDDVENAVMTGLHGGDALEEMLSSMSTSSQHPPPKIHHLQKVNEFSDEEVADTASVRDDEVAEYDAEEMAHIDDSLGQIIKRMESLSQSEHKNNLRLPQPNKFSGDPEQLQELEMKFRIYVEFVPITDQQA